MIPPVIAELRANFGDFRAKVLDAREEWAKTADTIRGTSVASAEAGSQMERIAGSTAHGAESMVVLREQVNETMGSIHRGLSSVVPGLGELTGVLTSSREAWREQKTAAVEALETARHQTAALRIEIGRLTVAIEAQEAKMMQVAPGSRAFDVANSKVVAYREQVEALNRQLVITNREQKSAARNAGFLGGGKRFLGLGAAGATAAGVAVAGVIGYEGVKNAMAEQTSLELLRNAVSKTKESFAAFREPLESATKQMRALGFADADTMQATQMLTSALGDPEKALHLVGLAANVARARHIDLATATKYVQKVATGHVETLGRLGLKSKDAAGNTLSVKQAIDALGRAYGGAGAAYSHTLRGQLSELKAQTEHVLVGIGNRLIPVLERFGEAVRKAGGWVREHIVPPLREMWKWFVEKIEPGIRKVVGILVGAYRSAIHSVTESLHKHQGQVHKVVEALRTVAEFVVNKVLPVLARLEGFLIKVVGKAIGYVIDAISLLVDAFGAIKRAAGDAAAAILNYFIKPVLDQLIGFAQTATGLMAKAFGWLPKIGGPLKDAKKAVDEFARATDFTLQAWADSASQWGDKAGKNLVKGVKDAKLHAKDAVFNLDGNYSDSVDNVVKRAKARHKKAHKDALAELRKRLEEEKRLALAAAEARAAAERQRLQAALDAVKEQLRQALVRLKLAGSGDHDLSIVNGSALNRGSSFADFARQRNQQTSVTISAGGLFMDAKTLARLVADALRADGRNNVNVGLT